MQPNPVQFPRAEYEEAIAFERESRDYAFLSLPRSVCGVDLVPMTLLQLMERLSIECPFLDQREPEPGEIVSFLWHLSLARERTRFNPLAAYHARNRLLAAATRITKEQAKKEIREYLDFIFLDSPGTTEANKPPYTSVAATFVDIFASNYGWTRAQILAEPIPVLYGLLREISGRKNPEAIFFNRRSDKVKSQFIQALDAANRAAAASTSPSNEGAKTDIPAAPRPQTHLDVVGTQGCKASTETISP